MRFSISHEHINLFHVNFFTSWVADIGIIEIFEQLQIF